MKKRMPPPPATYKSKESVSKQYKNNGTNGISTIASTIIQGFGFGTGSEIGRNVVRSIFSNTSQETQNTDLNKCDKLLDSLIKTCSENKIDNKQCIYLNKLYESTCNLDSSNTMYKDI